MHVFHWFGACSSLFWPDSLIDPPCQIIHQLLRRRSLLRRHCRCQSWLLTECATVQLTQIRVAVPRGLSQGSCQKLCQGLRCCNCSADFLLEVLPEEVATFERLLRAKEGVAVSGSTPWLRKSLPKWMQCGRIEVAKASESGIEDDSVGSLASLLLATAKATRSPPGVPRSLASMLQGTHCRFCEVLWLAQACIYDRLAIYPHGQLECPDILQLSLAVLFGSLGTSKLHHGIQQTCSPLAQTKRARLGRLDVALCLPKTCLTALLNFLPSMSVFSCSHHLGGKRIAKPH